VDSTNNDPKITTYILYYSTYHKDLTQMDKEKSRSFISPPS